MRDAQHPLADARRHRDQLAGVVERGQRGAQLGGRLEARRGIALEAAHHERLERLGNRRVDGRAAAAALLEPLLHRREALFRGLRSARPPADEHLVEDQPERVDVGARVDGLRRCPAPATCTPSVPTMRPSAASSADAEMPKSMISACSSSPRLDHDVGRLQVAVDDAGFVRGLEAAGDLPREPQRARDRQLAVAPQHRRQVVALRRTAS